MMIITDKKMKSYKSGIKNEIYANNHNIKCNTN